MNNLAFGDINNVIPGWNDPEGRKRILEQLSNYARAMNYKFQFQDVGTVLMVYKAMMFDKMVTGHKGSSAQSKIK